MNTWNIGEIDATSESPVLNLLVWNNRAGAADVGDMQDCTVACYGGADANLTDHMIVKNWMKVKVNSAGESAFADLGANAAAGGAAILHPMRAAGTEVGTQLQPKFLIKGTANTGALTDAVNFADIDLKVVPDANNAPAGNHSFIVRFNYFYT